MMSEPVNQIPIKGLSVWRLYGVIGTIIALFIAVGISVIAYWYKWPIFIYYLLVGIVIIDAIATIWIIPNLRWRHWRYDVREHEIETQSGIIIVKKTIIPMIRVQHVDTSQGPILKRYSLANVSISTAATIHVIPMLLSEDADQLRERISVLARVTEDDV
nr:PH domain-containing protein [Lysinibacillus timonensis]